MARYKSDIEYFIPKCYDVNDDIDFDSSVKMDQMNTTDLEKQEPLIGVFWKEGSKNNIMILL